MNRPDPKRLAIYFTKHSSPNDLGDKEYQHIVPEPWREPGKGKLAPGLRGRNQDSAGIVRPAFSNENHVPCSVHLSQCSSDAPLRAPPHRRGDPVL